MANLKFGIPTFMVSQPLWFLSKSPTVSLSLMQLFGFKHPRTVPCDLHDICGLSRRGLWSRGSGELAKWICGEFKYSYPLVMTNIANRKDPPFLMGISTSNWRLSIAMLVITRGYSPLQGGRTNHTQTHTHTHTYNRPCMHPKRQTGRPQYIQYRYGDVET